MWIRKKEIPFLKHISEFPDCVFCEIEIGKLRESGQFGEEDVEGEVGEMLCGGKSGAVVDCSF
jgi:hypothetical protein